MLTTLIGMNLPYVRIITTLTLYAFWARDAIYKLLHGDDTIQPVRLRETIIDFTGRYAHLVSRRTSRSWWLWTLFDNYFIDPKVMRKIKERSAILPRLKNCVIVVTEFMYKGNVVGCVRALPPAATDLNLYSIHDPMLLSAIRMRRTIMLPSFAGFTSEELFMAFLNKYFSRIKIRPGGHGGDGDVDADADADEDEDDCSCVLTGSELLSLAFVMDMLEPRLICKLLGVGGDMEVISMAGDQMQTDVIGRDSLVRLFC